MDGVVLVLNQNYEPLNVCNLPRAFRLVFGEKAEVIEYDHQVIRTPRTEFRAPSVIRLQHQVRRPRPAGQADAARGLRPRPAHLPVLRPPGARPDARPHRAAPSRRRPHVGEPRHGVQVVQPPQGRQDARGGAAAPAPRRRSSRAATSTRCSRRTSPTSATRRGGRTCSWAGTDGGDRRRAIRAAPSRRPVRDLLGDALGGRPRRVRRRAGRCATSSSVGRPVDWDLAHRTPGPSGSSSSSPAPSTRTGSGRSRCGATARSSRSRPSGPTTTTPTSAARTGSSSATRSRLDLARRDFTVNAMAWGARARASRPASSTRTAAGADIEARLLRAVGDPAAAVRGGRPPDGPRGPPRGDARLRDRGRRRWRRSGHGRRSSPTCRASGSPPSSTSCSARRAPVGRPPPARATRALLAAISPELAAQRGIPQNKIARRGPVGPHAPVGRCRAGGPAGRPAGGARSTTSASRRRSPTATSSATTRSAPSSPATFLDRLRSPRAVRERVVHLVRHHMFSYESSWSDAAVRRFIGKMADDRRRGARRAVRAARGGQRRVGPAGRGRAASTSSGRGSPPSSPRMSSLDRAGLAIDGDGPHRRSSGSTQGPLPRPDPRGRCSSGSSRTRRSTSARRCSCSPRRHADGGPLIELLLEAERAMEMGRDREAAETLYRQVIDTQTRAMGSRSSGSPA